MIALGSPMASFVSCDHAEQPPVEQAGTIHVEGIQPELTSLPELPAAGIRKIARAEADMVTAANIGWESESFSSAATHQLGELAKQIGSEEKVDWESIADPDFESGALRSTDLEIAFDDEGVSVSRGKFPLPIGESHSGINGFERVIRDWLKPLEDATQLRMAKKVIGVKLDGTIGETTVLIESFGEIDGSVIQQNGRWLCRWKLPEGGAPPLLTGITAESYEEIHASHTLGTLFSDCTRSAIGGNEIFDTQIMFGINHWLKHIEKNHGLLYFVRNGLAIADVDGDGLDDVFLCQPAGLPNRLFLRNPDSTAREAAAECGLDYLDETSSALFVDFDNDGDQDAVLGTIEGLVFFENTGGGKFENRFQQEILDKDIHSLSAVDADNDGDLDLYVTVDFASSKRIIEEKLPDFVYHDANDGGKNILFRNNITTDTTETWKFIDATEAFGLEEKNRRHSLAAAWEDIDNDGDQDLYVANDYGQNVLYQNNQGFFKEVAGTSGVIDFGGGMSVTWGDYDRDGKIDLYVSNMYSSAGNRITDKANFMPGGDEAKRAIYTRFAKGNSLFKNLGGGEFKEVGPEMGVEVARWAWGSMFSDINNDGWEDILVANGYVTGEDTDDL
jgi:hypothetical protein